MMSASAIAACLAVASPALAQTAAPKPAETSVPAAASQAQTANPEAIVTEVVVTGGRRSLAGGLMKVQTAAETMSSITPAAIQEKLVAASPLQLATTTPGFNFGSTDAYGLTPRNFVSVRGLDQTEIGWMIEGVPGINPIVYFPYAEGWADNENISDITVTPGNSRLQDPILTASGGEFIESIRSPRNTFGGTVSGSAGSYNARRGFVDIDTGYVGMTGAKAFLSYSYTNANGWVGPGENTRNHVDFKVTEDWSSRAHSSLFFSYNNWDNGNRVAPLNLAQFNNGRATNFDHFQNSAVYVPGVNNAYNPLATGKLVNYLVASNNDFGLSDKITLYVTPYYRHGYINSPGEAALSPTTLFAGNQQVTPAFPAAALQNGKLMAQADTLLIFDEAGLNTYAEAHLTPANLLVFGYWHEGVRQSEISYYMPLDSAGNAPSPDRSAALHGTNGALISGINFAATTTTDEFYIGDTQSLLDDKLHVSVGFKYLIYGVKGTNSVIGAPPTFSAHHTEPMPRILVSYDLNDHNQLYANVTTNARMPAVGPTYTTQYSTTAGTITQVGNPNTKPEFTVGGQLGYRYQGPVIVDLTAFYMHLSDHQIATGALINGTVLNTAVSAGGETIKGVSIEMSTRSYKGFSAYGNAQYLDGTFDDNMPIRGDFIPTSGKEMVESPKWIANVGGRYENGPFFASITGKYVGSEYTTFLNNQTIPSTTAFDISFGYHLPDLGRLHDAVIRVNFTNIGDKPYIANVASPQPTAIATTGINGTPIPAAQPLYYVTAPRAVAVTLSSKF
jgi:iron complex outermembrane receptor protein